MIKSVRIKNFRSIEELTFRPLEEGITGILGSTGAGKSSILTAVLYALYGVTPEGVTVKELRRDGSATSDVCSVSVLFTDDGQEIEIIREIKGAAGRVTAFLYVDGIEQTVDSVGVANKWIQTRLGIDAKGFMTAFVVRQKELEDIVDALPSVRKKQIERLAGIETLSVALQKARKEENLSKDLLKNLPGSKEDVENAEAILNSYQKNAEAFMESYHKAQENLTSLEAQLSQIVNELNSITEQERSIREGQAYIASRQEMISTNETLLNSVLYVKDIEEQFDIEQMRETHKAMYATLNEKRSELSNLEHSIKAYESSVINLQAQFDALRPLNEETLALSEDDLRQAIQNAEELDAAMVKKQHEARGRKSDLEESIATLAHSDDCPTCHTHLGNKPALLEAFQKSIQAFSEDIESGMKASLEAKEARKNAQNQLTALASENEEKARQTALTVELESLKSSPIDSSKTGTIREEIIQLENEMEVSAAQGLKVKDIERDREVYVNTQNTLSALQQQITTAEIRLTELMKTYDSARSAKLQQDYQRLSNEERAVKTQFAQFESNRQEQEKKVAISENALSAATKQWNGKKDLLEKTEKQALTRDLIEKYRKDTIASLTPELSENASLLIADMTSGAFVGVTIDEDFVITVETRAGKTRKVTELSGGEEAAVALSLRLAVAALITGNSQHLAWLDEVLTAQDADRRSSMLETIRDLSIRQVIMINHTSDAADIADRIVMLDNGAIVESSDSVVNSTVKEQYSDDDWGSLTDD